MTEPQPNAANPTNQDLVATMKFIQDSLNGLGPASYNIHFHDNAQAKDWTTQIWKEVSGVVADANTCRIDFHTKLKSDGQVKVDESSGFTLRDARFTLIGLEHGLNDAKAHPSWVVTVDSGGFSLRVNIGTEENFRYSFYFPKEDLATRVANAMTIASKLCNDIIDQTQEPHSVGQALNGGAESRPALATSSQQLTPNSLNRTGVGVANPAQPVDSQSFGNAVMSEETYLSQGSDLGVVMKFIQDNMNGRGPVNYGFHYHDNAKGNDWTQDISEEITGVVADVSACRIDYHIKTTSDGKTDNDRPVSIQLRDLSTVEVSDSDTVLKTTNLVSAHPSWTIHVVPQIFIIQPRLKSTSGRGGWIAFSSEAVADRISKAMVEAVRLCSAPASNAAVVADAQPTKPADANPPKLSTVKPPQSGGSKAPTIKAQQSKKNATLLVDTDDACHFFIDDEDKGVITPDVPTKFDVGIGEHILKCKNDTVPDLVWRKVVEAKDTSQVAAVVSLKKLHIEYDQAISKVQNQNATADATAAKQLAEAQAEEKQREAAKTEFPKKIFDTVKGTWGIDIPVPPWCLNGICMDRDPIKYRLSFKELVADRGILFTLEWTDYNTQETQGTLFGNPHSTFHLSAKGNRYEGYYTPSPPNRLQGVSHDCDRMTVTTQKSFDWVPCGSVDEGFAPGTVTILSQDQIELLYGDKRLVLTRK